MLNVFLNVKNMMLLIKNVQSLLLSITEEETQEFMDNPCYEEAADMIEVIKAFCHLNRLEWEVALGAAERKEEERGGFYQGIILQEVK